MRVQPKLHRSSQDLIGAQLDRSILARHEVKTSADVVINNRRPAPLKVFARSTMRVRGRPFDRKPRRGHRRALSRAGIVPFACSPVMMERWYLRECVRSISVNGVANGRLVYDAAFRPHFRDHRQCDIDGCLGASHAGEEQGRPPPVNFINCWTNGEQAAAFRKADFAHTAVGPAPHRTAIVF